VKGIRFVKGHGTENDFIILPDFDGLLALSPVMVVALCDRRSGLGADGVIRVVKTASEPAAASMAADAEWFMDYRNADGSTAEMCGNGIRVMTQYLLANDLMAGTSIKLATRAGVKKVRAGLDSEISVDIGQACIAAEADVEVSVPGRGRWPGIAVDLGNPHVVVAVEGLTEPGDLSRPPIVIGGDGFPAEANVEFVVARGPLHLAMRVYERGVGETRSCGTGACAAAEAALRPGSQPANGGPLKMRVDVAGGRLTVTRQADGQLTLTGPAVLGTSGEVDPQSVGATFTDG
jgi:diaminopimelate epimerase